jgi:hypothetical protein
MSLAEKRSSLLCKMLTSYGDVRSLVGEVSFDGYDKSTHRNNISAHADAEKSD